MDCSVKLKLPIPPDPFPIYCQVHGIRMQDCRGNNNVAIPSFIQSPSEYKDEGERYSLLPWRLLLNGQREGREEKSLERGREGRSFQMKREG